MMGFARFAVVKSNLFGWAAVVGVCALGLFAGCTPSGPRPQPLFDRRASEETGIDFVNRLRERPALNVVTYELFYNGGGVGIGDVNGDDRPDVFMASNMGASRLYLNQGALTFDEATRDANIDTRGKWSNGVTMVDINGDTYLDIYVSHGGPFADPQRRANALYVNQGDGTFVERAEAYGLADTGHTTHAAFFDYDRDGDLDVYLLTNGIGRVGPNVIRPKKTRGEAANTDRLYQNNGDGTFTNVSAAAGIQIEGYGLGVAVRDFNRDGWPDVYVANDYLANDLLYVNQGDGTFVDRADTYLRHQSYSAMGTDVADINNDGLLDVFTLDMLPTTHRGRMLMFGEPNDDRHRSELLAGYDPQFVRNTLQLNRGRAPDGKPVFAEIGRLAGVQATDWSWSALLADFDNDGWRDLTVTNGIPRDITHRDYAAFKAERLARQRFDRGLMQEFVRALRSVDGAAARNRFFENQGDLTFRDRTGEWLDPPPSVTTGAAYGDLDGDGDLDLIFNNVNAKATVLENRQRQRDGGNYLQVRLRGPSDNTSGIGASLRLYADSLQAYHEHALARGYKSTVDGTVHFGLGPRETIDSLVVSWPDGRRQRLTNLAINQRVTLRAGDAEAPAAAARRRARATMGPRSERLFQAGAVSRQPRFKHEEQYYADYKVQPLLPHKHSQLGPGLAVGDVNGDGRGDLYVGGAFEQPGAVIVQQSDGSFENAPLRDGKSYEEDMGALFFDADGDADQDLYIVSGGSEFERGSTYYQDRLYRNDGEGRWTRDPNALPAITASGSTVNATDYDRDGDLDLFVGGRLEPGSYPMAPRSYLLENRGGSFIDVTSKVGPDLERVGMVTGALWTDVNNDRWMDLLLVGEWMPLTLFINDEGHLREASGASGLEKTVGWWNSIVGGDFDQDGDTDYIAGNWGHNAEPAQDDVGPIRMQYGDVNGDGRVDPIMSWVLGDARYPVHTRDAMIQQIPSLRDRFPSYSHYAEASIEDLLQGDVADRLEEKTIDTFATSYVENRGDGTFRVRPLPLEAQMAPVFGLTVLDANRDGCLDVAMVGNFFPTRARSGRYDAFNGLLLTGDCAGALTPMRHTESGFFVSGDATGLVQLNTGEDWRLLVAARNDEALRTHLLDPGARVGVGLSHRHTWPVQPSDAWAYIYIDGGRTEKREAYHGSGYLSQTMRDGSIWSSVDSIVVYELGGERRLEYRRAP